MTPAMMAIKTRGDGREVIFYIGPSDKEPEDAPQEFVVFLSVPVRCLDLDPPLFEVLLNATKAHLERLYGRTEWTAVGTAKRTDN